MAVRELVSPTVLNCRLSDVSGSMGQSPERTRWHEDKGSDESHLESCTNINQLSFEDIPTSVLSLILSKTTPQDVARLTVVNRQWEEATRSDYVWNAFLPTNAREIARSAHGGPLVYQSAKELFHQLTNHVLLGDGTQAMYAKQGYWLDRKTGGVCRSLSGVALEIVWGQDTRYWKYASKAGSRFPTVAQLKLVWWLDMSGEIEVKLPPGEYTISWVLQIDQRGHGWNDAVTCSLVKNGATEKAVQILLSKSLRGWVPYNFANFTVASNVGDRERLEDVRLKFSLHNHNCIYHKGLWVDGVIIRSGKFDIPFGTSIFNEEL